MPESTENVSQVLDIVVQIVIVVLPIVLSWFLRNYVRGTTAEKEIAAIAKLANNAIDYVENLDNRGGLNLPDNVSKGLHKLGLASGWLEGELARTGITISQEEAGKWISSEFQKRLGDVKMVGTTAELAQDAVRIIRQLEQSGLLELPPEADKITNMVELAADWLVTRMAEKGAVLSRDDAVTWVRSEFLESLNIVENDLPLAEQLASLAKSAINHLNQLKSKGQLSIYSRNSNRSIDKDLAMAWLLTEAANRGLPVTTEDLIHSLDEALVAN